MCIASLSPQIVTRIKTNICVLDTDSKMLYPLDKEGYDFYKNMRILGIINMIPHVISTIETSFR